MEENEFIDVEFKEESTEKEINGKPLYYTTSQVGQMIGETDSTIRFWCTKFKKMLDIEMSGSHRRFKEEDIERLKYIRKLLREQGYSISQVVEFGGEKDKNKIETQLQKQEPLAMQALATAMAIEIGGQLEDFKLMIKEELTKEIQNNFKMQQEIQESNKNEIKEFIAVSIENQLEKGYGDIKSYLDNQELQARERDQEILDLLKKGMEERNKLTTELKEKDKNKGFFGKFFGK